jgi:heme-degrading monooxygenase HmoA
LSQIVTVSFFQFDGWRKKWWAFGQMGKRAFLQPFAKGASFVKMFGAGSGNGFSLMPDFGTYGLLTVWDSEESARLFFNKNKIFQSYQSQSKEIFTVFLQPIMAHGKWDGQEPFQKSEQDDPSVPIAVLTRGTVKPKFIIDFLRFTRSTSHSMENADGNLLSIGIGEVPIMQQATFSIWENMEAMKNYAYKNPEHTEVIKKTRELGWYSEELFARFKVLYTEGVFKNLDSSSFNKNILNK